MPTMRKANRVVNVDKNSAVSYLARGYDQISDNGEVEKPATGGRSISIAEHNKAVEESTKLKQVNSDNTAIVKALEEEVVVLNKEVERLTGILERKEAKGK